MAITTEAANWVVNSGIRLIGIDYLSIQRYKDPEPLTHQILLEAGVDDPHQRRRDLRRRVRPRA